MATGTIVGADVAAEVREAGPVGPGVMGLSVVVMTCVTGWWDVIVRVEVTSMVVLALRTLWNRLALPR